MVFLVHDKIWFVMIFLDSPFRVGVENGGKSVEFNFCHVLIMVLLQFFHILDGNRSGIEGPYRSIGYPPYVVRVRSNNA